MSYVTSQLQTNPASVTFGAGETWTLGIDCTNYLTPYTTGTAPTLPATVFTLQPTGTPVTLPDAPTVNGNVVQQKIAKSLVKAGYTYQLTLTFTPSGTADTLETVVEIVVPNYT